MPFDIILTAFVDAEIAQLVEQRTENPRVGSSILPLATTIHKAFSFLVVSLFSFGEHMVNIISSLITYITYMTSKFIHASVLVET